MQIEKYTILIVDDEPTNIDVLSGILKDSYKIAAAKSGQRALAHCRSGKKPDVILLDVMMPEMDGFEVLHQLKCDSETSQIPVIFVTANNEEAFEERGFSIGAVDYITKPVVPAIVKSRVDNQIRLAEARKKIEKLASQLSKYLSPELSKSLASGEKNANVGSKRKNLTVFFSDIVNFTARTEHMEPEDLTNRLNMYLEVMVRIALKYGGTVDKYIGDAIMVFFGDMNSKGEKDDAVSCVNMALEMQAACSNLASEWGLYNGEPFKVRMGIATGYCTVGNFGGESKLDYTIIGNTVNLASRMETQAGAGEIFVDQACWNQVKNSFSGTSMGLVNVKGFYKPVKVYRIDNGGESSWLHEESEGFKLSINFDEIREVGRIKGVLENAITILLKKKAKH